MVWGVYFHLLPVDPPQRCRMIQTWPNKGGHKWTSDPDKNGITVGHALPSLAKHAWGGPSGRLQNGGPNRRKHLPVQPSRHLLGGRCVEHLSGPRTHHRNTCVRPLSPTLLTVRQIASLRQRPGHTMGHTCGNLGRQIQGRASTCPLRPLGDGWRRLTMAAAL